MTNQIFKNIAFELGNNINFLQMLGENKKESNGITENRAFQDMLSSLKQSQSNKKYTTNTSSFTQKENFKALTKEFGKSEYPRPEAASHERTSADVHVSKRALRSFEPSNIPEKTKIYTTETNDAAKEKIPTLEEASKDIIEQDDSLEIPGVVTSPIIYNTELDNLLLPLEIKFENFTQNQNNDTMPLDASTAESANITKLTSSDSNKFTQISDSLPIAIINPYLEKERNIGKDINQLLQIDLAEKLTSIDNKDFDINSLTAFEMPATSDEITNSDLSKELEFKESMGENIQQKAYIENEKLLKSGSSEKTPQILPKEGEIDLRNSALTQEISKEEYFIVNGYKDNLPIDKEIFSSPTEDLKTFESSSGFSNSQNSESDKDGFTTLASSNIKTTFMASEDSVDHKFQENLPLEEISSSQFDNSKADTDPKLAIGGKIFKASLLESAEEFTEYKASDVYEQIKINFEKALNDNKSFISFDLHPADLGKLDIKIEIINDIIRSIEINAEKNDTIELLQGDIEYLRELLYEVTKTDDTSLSFNLKDQSQNHHKDQATKKSEDDSMKLTAYQTFKKNISSSYLLTPQRACDILI